MALSAVCSLFPFLAYSEDYRRIVDNFACGLENLFFFSIGLIEKGTCFRFIVGLALLSLEVSRCRFRNSFVRALANSSIFTPPHLRFRSSASCVGWWQPAALFKHFLLVIVVFYQVLCLILVVLLLCLACLGGSRIL